MALNGLANTSYARVTHGCPSAQLRQFRLNSLLPCHFLCLEQHQSQITLFHATEQAAELCKHACAQLTEEKLPFPSYLLIPVNNVCDTFNP